MAFAMRNSGVSGWGDSFDAPSCWIWLQEGAQADQYAEFTDEFTAGEGDVSIRISADTTYALYLNGDLVYAGQYADFPHYKIYDEIDLTPLCRSGKNSLCIAVWHHGKGHMGYYPGNAALRYEVWQKGDCLCCSLPETLSRLSPVMKQGLQKRITPQLGFSFACDLTRRDDWLRQDTGDFHPSAQVVQTLPLFPRPVARLNIGQPLPHDLTQISPTFVRADLRREEAGFLHLKVYSEKAQEATITFGEHIADGHVRNDLKGRDFSVQVTLQAGWNQWTHPLRRLGCRYLELTAGHPVSAEALTLLPTVYPLKRRPLPRGLTPLQTRIYETCVHTLRCCMHEHYEDTPWREQALYALDSRNQMLCGYDAFGEYPFARANLLLISKDCRPDGLLSICTPSSDDLTIPSFSLHYFTAVKEYTLASGDKTLFAEIRPKLESILTAFLSRMEGDLIPVFEDRCHWNFYEWSPGLSGKLMGVDEKRFDAALNCLLILALTAYGDLLALVGETSPWQDLVPRLQNAVAKHFWREDRGVFINSTEDETASELVNALAVLSGVLPPKKAAFVADKLAQPNSGMTPCTLSMRCFVYDALLSCGDKWRTHVIEDIDCRYSRMLAAGATTFWETEDGESAFDRAGSLCHGWSAMPIVYYHRLIG